MVLYGISLLYQSNQELEQAKDFAERAFTLDAVAYPAKMQYERLQQLANIAEGLGDNVVARRYRQMSFRHRMAHSIYPGDPQYNDFAKRRRSLWIVCVSPAVAGHCDVLILRRTSTRYSPAPPASRGRTGLPAHRRSFQRSVQYDWRAPPERGDAESLFFAIRIDLIADTQYAKPAETY